ncbi:MAG TPA: carboxypeptidase regulatory-like domain-containing protein [Thermoanaerobaculia bacterium]
MRNLIAFLLVTLLAIAADAQTTLSTLVGRVTAADAGVPGVTVSVTSPALQGQRSAVTGPDGQYVLPALPPGDYLVTFALDGMQQVIQRAQLRLSETTRVDAAMQQRVSEEIVVRSAEETVIETPQVSMNIDARTVELLPTTRGILDYAKLVPGVVELSLQGGRTLLAISGAQPYDNLYMVNGVTITDRRSNQPLNLYIEDTIQEATILTAGVSAEYGRFIGGVVNVITKSGGNSLSGSIRDTITSHAWTEKTPFPGELDHLDDIDHEVQGTLGGRIVEDRLWFFLAGRNVAKDFGRQTRLTNIGYTYETAEHRYEGKLTGNLTPSHSLVGSYLNVRSRSDNEAAGAELRSAYHARNAFSLAALRYAGIFRESILVEGQFSSKQRTYRPVATTPDVDGSFLNGSLISAGGTHLWAPVVCVVCGPEEGHGRDVLLKVSRFLPTARFGAHQLLAGADEYHDLGRSIGGVSSSNFQIYADADADGAVATPRFIPGETQIDYYDGRPQHRADFRTRSLFVNDQVTLGTRVTVTAGLRYDQNHGQDVDGRVVVNDARLSPRLGLVFDLHGNGKDRFSTSFGRYSSKALENPLAPATTEFSPTIYEWIYDGPEITGLPTAQAMAQLAAWFEARGGLEDRSDAEVFPTLGYDLGRRLTSPATDEYTVGYGHQFGSSGMVQVHYINRHSFDYYTVHQTTAMPKIVVDNNSGDARREYDAISLEGRWRSRRFNAGGTYNWSKLYGNVEQASNGSPVAETSGEDWYPEYSQYPQFKPMGWLANDLRHVANLWVGYDLSTERTHINVSALQRFHTGRNYSAVAAIQVRNIIPNPGYEFPPNGLVYYFQPRGELRLDDITSTGIALNAARRFGLFELFGQFDVTNVFGEDGIENAGIDTVVFTNSRDRNLAPFNPITTTPIECPPGVASSSPQCRGIAHYRYSPTFGQPTTALAYQQPRTYSVAFGARF